MAVENVVKRLALDGKYLNLPAISGIQHGYWYHYVPVNVGNTSVAAAIKPYRWADALPLASGGTNLTIEGSIPYIQETWEGSTKLYHGGCIEWVGAGVNDITNTPESDAFFFAHLGALSANDNPYYWDRAYVGLGGTEWEFYQYHQHLPNVYVGFDNGRAVFSGGGSIVPEDKSYGYTIHTQVSVMGTPYNSVMARIHTPSVGGAHNSHNDVTLPLTQNRNYLMSGILKGNSDRFHVLYISPSGAQWEVFIRTYVDTAASFTNQVSLGIYDLADPVFNPVPTTGTASRYPIRASCGVTLGSRIYFPVVVNNATSGFDLKIFSFESLDTIAGGSLQITTIQTGSSVVPDCHLKVLGGSLYALATNAAAGGATLYKLEGSTWVDSGQIVTNSNSNFVRIHGFDYNAADVKFYAMLSGTAGGAGTYTGPGIYSFNLVGDFDGYKHLDYDRTTNSFVSRNELQAGHLIYSLVDSTVARSPNTEPQGISTSVNILTYETTNKKFFNKTQNKLDGTSYYYQGIALQDGRKMMAGRILGDTGNLGFSDMLVSIFSDTGTIEQHFSYGGAGDDYITSLYQSKIDPNKVWFTGYTKSELVQKRDMKIHGWLRNLNDGPNAIRWVDVSTDADGNIYTAGNHLNEYIVLAKYDYNYNLIWQKTVSLGVNADIAYGLSVIGSHVYIASSTANDGASTKGMLLKLDLSGDLVYSRIYTSGSGDRLTSVSSLTKDGSTCVVMSLVNPTGGDTTFIITDANGTILEQKTLSDLLVERVRDIGSTLGTFAFSGTASGTSTGKFGVCQFDSDDGFVKWISSFANKVSDIREFDGDYVLCGTEGSNSFIMRVAVSQAGTVYTPSIVWNRTVSSCVLSGLTINQAGEIYSVGYTSADGWALEDGFLISFDSSGTFRWQNTLGHTADERLLAVTNDVLQENIISVGWSRSHSFGTDAIMFRCENGGFGTGHYHAEENPSMAYIYQKSTLATSVNSGSITTLTVPSDVSGTSSTSTLSATADDGFFTNAPYDGSYGPNGLWMLMVGYIDLKEIQKHFNTALHKEHIEVRLTVEVIPEMFKIYQVGTVGDGLADDGNIFGYDIIETTDGELYIAAQTSGDIRDVNLGITGAYDYLLVEFDPVTEEFDYYQNSGPLDEEIYALTEMANGKIAYVGRTAGELAGPTIGGYDIFLGIFDPVTETSQYFRTGTGFEDKAVNVHDIGNDTLAVVFSTLGTLGEESQGTEDIGVILFNYATNTWGTAYQTGSSTSEIFEQNGKPSVYLSDGRIAIVGHTSGIFADDSRVYGQSDIFLAILDLNTGEWKKYQVGSSSSDFASSVYSVGDSGKLLIAGYTAAQFSEISDSGIFVEFDISKGVGAKAAVD